MFGFLAQGRKVDNLMMIMPSGLREFECNAACGKGADLSESG